MTWILLSVIFLGFVVLPILVSRRYRDDPGAVERLKREEYNAQVRHIWFH